MADSGDSILPSDSDKVSENLENEIDSHQNNHCAADDVKPNTVAEPPTGQSMNCSEVAHPSGQEMNFSETVPPGGQDLNCSGTAAPSSQDMNCTDLPPGGHDLNCSESSVPGHTDTELPSGGGDHGLMQLKKDDSGIDVERSPVKEGGSDDSSSTRDTRDDSAPGRPSTSNESEGLVADIDTDDEAAVGESPNVDAVRMSDTDSGSDVEGVEAVEAESRRHPTIPGWSSSSSSDSEPEGDPPDLPKDKWRPLSEIKRRELGWSNTAYASDLFRRRCGSSVQLVRRLELLHKMSYHDGCVNALHFNKSGSLLASGSDDLNIVLWDWVFNKPYLVFDSGHRSNVFQAKFVPYSGDTHVVSCARDGQVRLAELSSTGVCKNTKKLAQHRGAAHKLALLQDSAHELYSCGEDAVTYHLDLRQNRPNKLCTTKENDRQVALYSIHAHPLRSWEFCVGGRDHFVRVYDKRQIGENNAVLKKFCPEHLVESEVKANVTCAVYSYNGDEILGTYNDEDIYLFRSDHSDGASHVHHYTGHRNNATVKGVNFYGPCSEFIVSGSDCSNVYLWEKESEKVVQYFHADDGGVVNVLEPHPHAPILATSGLDHDVKIWTPTASEPSNLKGLARMMRNNNKERLEERENEPEMIDGQMMWLLMQHLRRSARRRARNEGENLSSSSSDHSDHHDDDDEDGDDDAEMREPNMQCVPS